MKRFLAFIFCVGPLLAALPLWGQSRRYALILEDPPIADRISSRKELRSQAALDAGARIEAAQQALRQRLAERKIRVTGAVKHLMNAVFVEVSDERELQGLEGVRRAAWLRPLRRHLDRALPLVNAPQAWAALSSAGLPNAGAGIKIGILDTGIDQNHPAFQDPALTAPSGFPVCDPAYTAHCAAYTNSKVIVARSYVALNAGQNAQYGPATSRPDDYSPRDRVGHGTAAAMVAAGVQNKGPLATITGVAPKAYLGNYKISGSPGVNDGVLGDAFLAAMDDAFADGMDIVTLSFGIPAWYGPLDKGAACQVDPNLECDVYSQTVERAMAIQHNGAPGMVVVISAGNDGEAGLKVPTLNSVHTPGVAPSAVTVGASRNGHLIYSSASLTAQDAPTNLRKLNASFGDGPRFAVAGPLRDVAQLGNDGLACAPLGAGSLNGAIALVQRGTCDFAVKVRNAKSAGAIGVLIYREAGGEIPVPPLACGGTGIPAAIVGNTDGRALKTYLQSHADSPAAMDPAFLPSVSDTNSDTVAAFSSRGPAIDSAIKPELVAPGTAIYTATQKYDINGDMYDSTGYTVAEGTSFAAPMVAGAVALAKQKNPGFSPAQLKSAVVNTASPLIPPDGQARIASAGAGKLNVEAVVRTNVTVEPATLSFGVVTAAAIGTQRTLKIANGSSAVVTLAVEQRDPDPNARLRLGATSVAAGRTDTIAVFLEGAVPAPGSYEGVIAVKGGAVDLRVPYLYLVGDGVPYNVFPVNGAGFEGIAGQYYGSIALKAVDQYGVAVRNANVTWRVTLGGGNIPVADSFTDIYGLAFAQVNLGSNPGDQEFTATVGTGASQLVLPFQGRARALPTIDTGGVIDAANGQAPQSGRGLAPGSYISIWGQNLAEVSLDFNAVLPAGIPFYLPVSLGGASVSFDVQDQRLSVPAQLTFVSPRQVNVQVPWELTGIGQASMKVTTGGFSTTVYTVFLSDSAPAVFEAPLGSGLAAAADALTGVVVGAANPMQKGRWVSIYANGLGPVSNTPATGEMSPLSPLAQCRFTPEVTIGGKVATVNFAGLTPTGIGYYQINALVPPDAPSGNQPVTVKVNGVAAKTVNLPIQ